MLNHLKEGVKYREKFLVFRSWPVKYKYKFKRVQESNSEDKGQEDILDIMCQSMSMNVYSHRYHINTLFTKLYMFLIIRDL